MDLSKSCLTTTSTQINHKVKKKGKEKLYLWPRCWTWNKGKRILPTVNNRRDSDFLMFTRRLDSGEILYWQIKHYACFGGNGNRM